MVAPLQADLLLPDFSGLDLVRRLAGEPGRVPYFLLVTAARDIDSVRTAMQFGAFYYLVKPFTFVALREQLKAYRAWAARLGSQAEADQNVVDALYSLRGCSPRRAAATRTLQPTMARVLDIVTNAAEPIGATEVAGILGASRPTAPAVPREPGEQATAGPKPQLRHVRTTRTPLPRPPPRCWSPMAVQLRLTQK
jgi:response regulator of citrate/malate metabolism